MSGGSPGVSGVDDGIVVTHVDFIDNQACLDVIEKVCLGVSPGPMEL